MTATAEVLDRRDDGPALTAEALGLDACAVAEVLDARGVRPGDRVLVHADNAPGYPAMLLALMSLDASVVLLDHRHTAAQRQAVAGTTGARWVLSDQPEPAPGCRLMDPTELPVAAVPGGSAVRPDGLARWRRRPDALITWSSGSTGEPKGIVKSGRAFLDNLLRTRDALGYRPDDVFLPLLPFSHQYGLSMVVLAWLSGAGLAVTPYRRLDRAVEVGGRLGATVVDGTPTTYRSLLRLDAHRPGLLARLDRVRLWCTGGAPLDGTLGRDFTRRTGAPLLDGYGSTEAGNVAFATPAAPLGCGRVLPGVTVRVTDPDGDPVPPGAVGELWVEGPDLMEGYLVGGRLNRLDPPDRYRTGDLGHLDPDGTLHVAGRSAAVHRLGHTLYPEVLARRASACGRPVVVLPVHDDQRGCRLVFVVEDPEGGDGRRWRRRICALLPVFEHPNSVLVVPELPLTGTGKVDAGRLRTQVLDPAEAIAHVR